MSRLSMLLIGLGLGLLLSFHPLYANLPVPPEPPHYGTIPCELQGPSYRMYFPLIVSEQPEVWAAIPQGEK